MNTHLLSRRVRASLGYGMTVGDWLAHAYCYVTDWRYRSSVRALKVAFTQPVVDEQELPALRRATKDLKQGEKK